MPWSRKVYRVFLDQCGDVFAPGSIFIIVGQSKKVNGKKQQTCGQSGRKHQLPELVRPGFKRNQVANITHCQLDYLGCDFFGALGKGDQQGAVGNHIDHSGNSPGIAVNHFHRLPGKSYLALTQRDIEAMLNISPGLFKV